MISINKKTLLKHFAEQTKPFVEMATRDCRGERPLALARRLLALARRLLALPGQEGHLHKTQTTTAQKTTLTPASVLVPIIDEKELLVLFTERAQHLKDHAGQISFPGGKMETTDRNLADTALRETSEEIGLKRENITLLGTLAPVISTTGFLVTPFIGLITPPIHLVLDPNEVAAVFMAPLEFVLDPRNQQKELYRLGNKQKEIDVIYYQNHRIWGMTAKILVTMTRELHQM